MKAQLVAKTAIFNDQGKVLLLRRSDTDVRRPLQWDFPGGCIEPDELVEIGAVREILEESGIEISEKDLKLLKSETQVYDDGNVVIRFLYTATTSSNSEVRLSSEHDKYVWVDIDTAIEDFQHPFYGAGLAFAKEHGLV